LRDFTALATNSKRSADVILYDGQIDEKAQEEAKILRNRFAELGIAGYIIGL